MQRKNKKVEKTKDASKLTVGIVYSQYYLDEIIGSMLAGAEEVLAQAGVKTSNVTKVPVSGSWEIPYGVIALLKKKKVHTVITLGCVIKGETSHDHHISAAVSQGLMNISLARKLPISFGVMNANTMEQALARSRGDNNKGKEVAIAALEMALLKI